MMPVTFEKEYKGAKVAIWQITESFENLSEQLASLDASLKHPAAYTAEQRILQWYAVRILAESLTESTIINYDQHGRPWPDSGYISISHSHDCVAVIYHHSRAVGVDLQLIDEKVLRIAHKFINKEESPQSLDDHVRIWCIKEAAYKIQGTGSPYLKRDYTVLRLTNGNGNCDVIANQGTLSLEFMIEKHENFILAVTVE